MASKTKATFINELQRARAWLASERLMLSLARRRLLKPSPTPDGNVEKCGKRYQPQPAHLDEQQDDYLAERGELRIGVKYHKARHAGGGGSGEHGVQHVQHLSVPVGDGSISSSVPHRITARKLPTINRVGLVFLRRALWESASARENPFNRTPHFACLHRIIGY